jgi:hypothetical protein
LQFGWKFEFSPKAKFRWKKKLKRRRKENTLFPSVQIIAEEEK